MEYIVFLFVVSNGSRLFFLNQCDTFVILPKMCNVMDYDTTILSKLESAKDNN